jgi:hypothetical protein
MADVFIAFLGVVLAAEVVLLFFAAVAIAAFFVDVDIAFFICDAAFFVFWVGEGVVFFLTAVLGVFTALPIVVLALIAPIPIFIS